MATKKETKFDPSKLKRTVITLPLFKWKDATTKYLEITSGIVDGKAVSDKASGKPGEKKGEAQMAPARLCNVINLETGEEGQIIVGAVLEGIFQDNFDDESYVGRKFEIEQYKVEGKRYKGYKVTELS